MLHAISYGNVLKVDLSWLFVVLAPCLFNYWSRITTACQFSGPVMQQPQLLVSNMMRASTTGQPRAPLPNPIQRPIGHAPVPRPQQPSLQMPAPVIHAQPMQPQASSEGGGGSIRALQAKQRQEVLAHAHSFLNPSNKPRGSKVVQPSSSEAVTAALDQGQAQSSTPTEMADKTEDASNGIEEG